MVSTGTLPTIAFIQGNTFATTIKMQRKDENDVLQPFVLTDFTKIQMDFRDKPNRNGSLIARISLGDGIEIIGDDNELLVIKLNKFLTNSFEHNITPFNLSTKVHGTNVNVVVAGKYYTDIAFYVGDDVKTLLKADVIVMASITEIK
jgi:hypothetical protein